MGKGSSHSFLCQMFSSLYPPLNQPGAEPAVLPLNKPGAEPAVLPLNHPGPEPAVLCLSFGWFWACARPAPQLVCLRTKLNPGQISHLIYIYIYIKKKQDQVKT